jgi:hypothetical protein
LRCEKARKRQCQSSDLFTSHHDRATRRETLTQRHHCTPSIPTHNNTHQHQHNPHTCRERKTGIAREETKLKLNREQARGRKRTDTPPSTHTRGTASFLPLGLPNKGGADPGPGPDLGVLILRLHLLRPSSDPLKAKSKRRVNLEQRPKRTLTLFPSNAVAVIETRPKCTVHLFLSGLVDSGVEHHGKDECSEDCCCLLRLRVGACGRAMLRGGVDFLRRGERWNTIDVESR